MTIRAETQIDLSRVDDGSPGANGATFTPAVDVAGDISWTNDGGLPNPPTQNIMGPQGDPGTPGTNGVSVTSVEPEYYLSTSDVSPTGGSWSSTVPAFVTGCYYWTREHVTYSDGSDDYSTAVYNEGMTQASQDAYDADATATFTALHFWFSNDGTDDGAHITEVDRTTFTNTPAGGNLIATSQGVAVRDALKELAIMSADGFEAKTYDSNDNQVVIAHLGYGPGIDSGGGTDDAPYYDIGIRTGVIGNYSVAEGNNTEASGYSSHSEGYDTVASDFAAHAEGYESLATNSYAHAEGNMTKASGDASHAEGFAAWATNNESHAEGLSTRANGVVSHAEGSGSIADGDYSHAQNLGTKASSDNQTALGKYNVEDAADTYAVIVGKGTADNARSNALTVDWSGNVDAAGKYKSNGAQIGSVMKLHGSSFSSPLSTSYKTINLATTPDINTGNAFSAASNGIKCLYAGTVHLVGKIRFNDSFTANDYVVGQIYNTTAGSGIQTARIRSAFAVFNGDVWINAYATVSANDVLLLRAENATGGRGTVTVAECSLTACYVSS